MSNPLVAGCSAVLREAVLHETVMAEATKQNITLDEDQKREAIVNKIRAHFPSAALIKALLINGAKLLPPDQHTHNYDSGFGRVDLAKSLSIICRTGDFGDFTFEEAEINPESERREIPVKIPKHDGNLTLKVTLVWNDYQGATLQNDLDLAVKASDEMEYHGNIGATDFDRLNVEQVVWAGIPAGEATIVIKAHKLCLSRPFPRQPFACVWSYLT